MIILLKEIAIFGVGCAAGAAAMYYGSETVKNNVLETQQAMNELMGSMNNLQCMVGQCNAEMQQNGQVAAGYQQQQIQQQYPQQPVQAPVQAPVQQAQQAAVVY